MNIQSLLTMCAMLLVSMVSLQFNSSLLRSSTVEIENKVSLTAFSLADDMIEEIKNKSFDETTIQFPTTSATLLTKSDSLGPEPGETYAVFDDVDDYNTYKRTISAPHAENYLISCKVYYLKTEAIDETSTVQTFYKKAEVTVSSPYLRNSITLGFVFTLK